MQCTVSLWIKGNKIKQDPDGYVELNLARRFVQESKMHLDPVHQARALGLLGDVYGRRGDYTGALKQFNLMAKIYDPETLSLPISEAYGFDRCAQVYSFSALWHDLLGNSEKALASSEYIIQDILPMMDPTNTLGNFEILYCVIRVLKPKGQEERMLRLLDEYVISAFFKHHGPSGVTPCRCMFKPLKYLLAICSDPMGFQALNEAADWLCGTESEKTDDFVDNVFSKTCWSAYDVLAELCLRVANRLSLEQRDIEKQRLIIAKGLMLAEAVEKKMRDEDGNVVLPLSIDMHDPVYNSLKMVANQMGVAKSESGCSPVCPLDVNLPPSYLKAPDDKK